MKKTGFYAITAAAVLAAAGAAPLSSQAAQDPYLAAPGRVAAVFSVPAPAVGTLPGLSGLIRFPICTGKAVHTPGTGMAGYSSDPGTARRSPVSGTAGRPGKQWFTRN